MFVSRSAPVAHLVRLWLGKVVGSSRDREGCLSSGCTYTVLQTVLMPGVCGVVYETHTSVYQCMCLYIQDRQMVLCLLTIKNP